MSSSTDTKQDPGPVLWPQDAAAGDGHDLATPIVDLLKHVGLLSQGEDKSAISAAITGSSEGVTVIKSGAMALTKNWAALLGLTGSAAVATPFVTVTKKWWTELDANAQMGFLLACGLVAAACVIGICYLLASDVRGRASATTEQIAQRSAVVNEFLRTSLTLQNRQWEGDAVLKFLEAAVPNGSVEVKIGDAWEPVRGFDRRDGRVGVKYAGDFTSLVELSEYRMTPAPAPSGNGKPGDTSGTVVAILKQLEGWAAAVGDALTDSPDPHDRDSD